jgi:hypothetical protein
MGVALKTFANKVPNFLYPHRYVIAIYREGGRYVAPVPRAVPISYDNNEGRDPRTALLRERVPLAKRQEQHTPDYYKENTVVNLVNNSDMLSLLCTTAGLPRDTVKTSSLTWCGENVTWPLKMQSNQTWTCIITENNKGEIIKDIEEWLLNPEPYWVTISIIPLNDRKEPVYTTGIELHYAYLSGLTPTDLKSDSIQVFEWNLTFNYAYTRRIS